jgi:hypothetical protein
MDDEINQRTLAAVAFVVVLATACSPGGGMPSSTTEERLGGGSTILLKPTGGLGHTSTGTIGCPSTAQYKCVSDGTSLSASDGDKTYVYSTAAGARQGTSYAGAPAGRLTEVTTHVVAAAESGASGTMTIALYSGGRLLATSAAHALDSAYADYPDTFNVSVASADSLEAWVTFSNAMLKYTEIWLAVALAVSSDAGSDAATHEVRLDWTASTTPSVTYDAYRSTGCTGTYSLRASGITGTSWTDTMVTSGETYCYVTTAVSSSGQSIDSNLAKAVVP